MNLELLKMLKQKKKYHWNELKEKLNIFSDEDLIDELFNIVENGIEEFNVNSSSTKKHYIEKALHYLNYRGINDMFNNNEKYIVKIDKSIKDIHLILSSIYSDNKLYQHNKELLERILFALKQIKHKFYKINYSKKDYLNEVDELFDFMCRIMVEVENYKVYENLFNDDKDLINIINSDGYSLLDGIIDNCLKAIKSSNDDKKINYYKQMLKLLLKHDSNRFSAEFRLSLVDELEQLFIKINNSNLNIFEKKYRIKNIHELIEILSINYKALKECENLYSAMEKYGISHTYDSEYLKLCSEIKKDDSHQYQDHTDKFVFTLDKSNTFIFEDAICIEKVSDYTKLYFYTPLVADYIDSKSKINKYLEMQSSSIYCKNLKKHIIPTDISKKNFSFDEGVKKGAFTVEITLDRDYKVVDTNVYRSLISVKKNYLYNLKDISSNSYPELNDLISVAKKLSSFVNRGNCETVVNALEVFNLFCKKVIINKASSLNFPLIYKETTKQYLIDKLYNISDEMNLNNNDYVRRIIEIIKLQKYKNKVYTLKEMDNIPLTNPAREYASLLNQRILLQELVDRDIKCYYKDLESIIETLNNQEIKNKQFSTFCNNLNDEAKVKKDDIKMLTNVFKMIK